MLCRHLSLKLFASKADFHPIFDFLSSLQINGKPIMINDSISSFDDMEEALTKAERLLENMDAEVCTLTTPWHCMVMTMPPESWALEGAEDTCGMHQARNRVTPSQVTGLVSCSVMRVYCRCPSQKLRSSFRSWGLREG